MAYDVSPEVNALKKCMGWFLGLYNASAHAPATPLDGSIASEVPYSPLVPFPLPLKGILFGFLVIFVVSYARSSRQRLPPQPRPLPIIGNFFHLTNRRWLYSRD